jgi:hypothetical protein
LDIKTTSLCGPAGCFFFPLTKAVYMHIWFEPFLFYCCIKKNWGPSSLEAQLCRPVCTGLGSALWYFIYRLTSYFFTPASSVSYFFVKASQTSLKVLYDW